MTRRVWLMMGITAAVWGASYLFIEIASRDLPAAGVVCGRTAFGAVVLLAIGARRVALTSLREHLGSLALLAAVQVVVPFLLITLGEQRIATSLTGILVSSAPIFTALLAIRYDDAERMRGWGLAGIVTGMAGIVLLFGIDLSGEASALLGGAMVLVASLGYAIGGLLIKHRLRGVPPVGIAAATMSLSALMTLPLFLATLPDAAPGAGPLAALLALGAGGTGIAFLLFYTLIAEIGPARASIVAYIAPAFALVYGVTLLDEALTVGAVAGLALILAGSWLAAEGRLPAFIARSGPSRSSAPAPARAR